MKKAIRLENHVGLLCVVVLLTAVVLFLYIAGTFSRAYSVKYKHYSELPVEFKTEIEFFKLKAKENNADIRKLEKTKFQISPTKTILAPYRGACDIEKNIIYIPHNYLHRSTLWHELGHCIFNYDHSENNTELMHYTTESLTNFGEKEVKDFFSYKEKIESHSFWVAKKKEPIKIIILVSYIIPLFLILYVFGFQLFCIFKSTPLIFKNKNE